MSNTPDEQIAIKISASQTIYWDTVVTMTRQEWEQLKVMDNTDREQPFDGPLYMLLDPEDASKAEPYFVDYAYVLDDNEEHPVKPYDALDDYLPDEADES